VSAGPIDDRCDAAGSRQNPLLDVSKGQEKGNVKSGQQRRVGDVTGAVRLLSAGRADGTVRAMVFSIELEREDDGRWLAEVPALAGVMCYGSDRDEAVARVQALALRVIAERLEHREAPAEFVNVTFQAA
jgi:predicted RNase H-like HicB family nuclease